MVDFVTQSRHYGYRYNTPEKREAATNNRDVYRENAPKLFKTPRVQVHDCREDCMQDLSDRHGWEAWLFSEGLQNTVKETAQLHRVVKKEDDTKTKQPDKLLSTVGQMGHQKEHFLYPRSLTTTPDGDILVADSGNHRIQRFNQCGVFIGCHGEKGEAPDQYREPTSVALLTNGCPVVADKRNKRIQVLSESWECKYAFKTVDKPYYVCVDNSNNIVVSTVSGSLEIYRRPATLANRFYLHGINTNNKSNMAACPIAINDKDEVVVSNSHSGKVQYYSYKGELLYQFEPRSGREGLGCQIAGMCLNSSGQVLVADSLNHVINLYSERGALLSQLLSPLDDIGAVQAIALGPEGHLVVTEYTTNGTHCLKIFRYNECDCHPTQSALKSD